MLEKQLVGLLGLSRFTHETIRFDSFRSRFDSIRFDSNGCIIVVNQYSINLCVPNPQELQCIIIQLISLTISGGDSKLTITIKQYF